MIGDEIDLVEAELTRGGHMAGAEDGCGHELDYWFSDHRRGWLSAWIEETRHRPHHRLLSPVGAAQSRLPSSGSRGCSENRPCSQRCKAFPQCDMSTGTVIDRKMVRVTPPSTNSRKRAWP